MNPQPFYKILQLNVATDQRAKGPRYPSLGHRPRYSHD